MKIFVAGTRGIPDIPGGVEKHCQELFPRIAAKGHTIFLCTRSPYITEDRDEWRGVRLINCYAPRKKSFEAIVHTFIALLKARLYSPDIVHIHAIGPSLLTPFARMMGLRVVVTNHGPDYDRQKWGKLAKFVLRTGEKMGALYANEMIVISSTIKSLIKAKYQRTPNLIYNGVTMPVRSTQTRFLSRIGTRPYGYILAVARFVEEKGLDLLMEAFMDLASDYNLVIAGDADHETTYSKNLHKMAECDSRIILTGYIKGEPLNQLYTHARLFVLPSFHEGLPIALLEAMSYGLPVLVSDIPAHKEIGLPNNRYFRCGSINDLKDKIQALIQVKLSEKQQKGLIDHIREKYDWDTIAQQTIDVYRKVLGDL